MRAKSEKNPPVKAKAKPRPASRRKARATTNPTITSPHTLPPGKPDQLALDERFSGDRQEALLDEALDESFPASDPPSPKHLT